MRDHWTPNAGGVCDECGEPRFAHDPDDGACPTDADCQRMRAALDAWHAAVKPAADAYRRWRVRAKDLAGAARKAKPWATPEAVELACSERDELLVEYRAAIRRADREAAAEAA
jgi:hypothetical protein